MKSKKNNSTAKKLLPAMAMLATSAVMLTTATYAWFTMSKDVEVTGIQLTATTPELIEISLGYESGGKVVAPNNNDDNMQYWTHSVASSTVYSSFGKLMPASSINGNSIFATANVEDFGKSVSATATFFDVNAQSANDAKKQVQKKLAGITSTDELSDGYYLDIPVWFRTTKSENNIKIGVSADISYIDADHDSEVLYQAARVALLKSADNDNSDFKDAVNASPASEGVIMSETGSDKIPNATAKGRYYDRYTISGVTANQAVNYAGSLQDADNDKTPDNPGSIYGAADIIQQCVIDSSTNTVTNLTSSNPAESVLTINKNNNGSGYSNPTKYIIRIWLEGEDKACWNANASQSFVVGLNFYDIGDAS